MSIRSVIRTAKSIRIAVFVAGLAGLATGVMAWQLIVREQDSGAEDLDRRSRLLANRLNTQALGALERPHPESVSVLESRLTGYGQLVGMGVFRSNGDLMLSPEEVRDALESIRPLAMSAVSASEPISQFSRQGANYLHVFIHPVRAPDGTVKGAVAVVHDASYLDERMTQGLLRAFFWLVLVVFGLTVVTIGLSWLVYEGPLRRLADWMKRLRMGDTSESPPAGIPIQTLFEESKHLAASFHAARTSNWAKSQEVSKRTNVWNKSRLAAHATRCLGHDPLVVMSNREPYMHMLEGGQARVIIPASGMVTAVDPVLQACGGLWVAHGAGSGDRETSDSQGRLSVPPNDPRYTLKRVWLPADVEKGYYYGFANEGLWPLCHLAHERPLFRSTDWENYVEANRRFAEATLEEIGSGNAMVWIQDFHLALVPRLLRERRPDLRIGIFWHIPWPTAESFRTCPWGAELVQGILGADVAGFHLQQHCNNFLDTVDRTVEAKLDWDHFAAEFQGRRTVVRPFPISVQSWSERAVPKDQELALQVRDLKKEHGLDGQYIAVGVDRIDYTKGLPERLRAIRRLLEKHPEHRGRITFVQLGAPSRITIPRYRDLGKELESLAQEINREFQTREWKPILFLPAHHDASAVHAFLTMASMCIVSSLHDGMNLVAKEFVAAKSDGDGVLVLSQFAGASRELPEALIINPYDEEGFSEAIHVGIGMDPAERRQRMSSMHHTVEDNNVYSWAAGFLSELSLRKNTATQGVEG